MGDGVMLSIFLGGGVGSGRRGGGGVDLETRRLLRQFDLPCRAVIGSVVRGKLRCHWIYYVTKIVGTIVRVPDVCASRFRRGGVNYSAFSHGVAVAVLQSVPSLWASRPMGSCPP